MQNQTPLFLNSSHWSLNCEVKLCETFDTRFVRSLFLIYLILRRGHFGRIYHLGPTVGVTSYFLWPR